MAEYRYITYWEIEAPLEQVFHTILHSEHWPQWWHGVQQVLELKPGDSHGIGSIRRYVWQSPMLYRIAFEARAESIEQPSRIEASVSGDLAGSGCWYFSHQAGITTVRYEWRVHAICWWMRLLAGVLRLPFAVNHRILMRRGAQGLARRLQAPLVTAASFDLSMRADSGKTTLPRAAGDD